MFSTGLRHFLLVSVALVALATPLAAAEQGKHSFDVPAQGLSTALESFASQSGLQLLYQAELVAGLKAELLRGDYVPEQALTILLKGSGLEAKPTGPGSYSLVKAERPTVTRLDTITVTATRTPRKTFDLPVSATTVTRDQIEESQANDLGSIMRQIPGVTLDGTPRESGQLPAIRGAYGPDIIMRVDDARRSLDTSVGILTPLMLDHNFIKQVDVVRGPSSALHGSGGIGGVMAFQTIDADDIVAPGNIVGARSKTGWRSGNGSLSENLTGAAKYANASILASGTLSNAHNINSGAGIENTQKRTSENGLFKLGYAPNDLNDFKVSYLRYYQQALEPTNPSTADQYITAATGLNGYRYRERSQDEVSGTWNFRDGDRSWFDGKVNAYFTDSKTDTYGRYSANYDTTFNVTTTGGSAQNSTQFSTFDMGHRLTYGFDGYQDLLKNTSAGANNSVNPNGNMLAMGAFIQDEFQFARDWLLIATLRQDKYQAEATGYNANKNDHLSPKAALKWQVLKPLGLFASYGQAFRAPTLTELYTYNTVGFAQFRPNATLEPEVSRNFEIGATLAFDSVLWNKDAVRFKINRYDERVKNLIYSKTIATNTSQYQNAPHGARTGAEIESTYLVGGLGLNAGYSRVRVTSLDNANSLYSPPDKILFGANYYVDDYWSLRYAGNYVLSQQYDTTVVRRRKAYTVHDIGTAYDRSWYRLDFSITNLFDRAYMPYNVSSLNTSQIFEEGRSFNMFFTAKF